MSGGNHFDFSSKPWVVNSRSSSGRKITRREDKEQGPRSWPKFSWICFAHFHAVLKESIMVIGECSLSAPEARPKPIQLASADLANNFRFIRDAHRNVLLERLIAGKADPD